MASDLRKFINVNSRRYREGQQRRERFLESFARTRSVTDSCLELGMSKSGYARWRETFPEFRYEIARIRGDKMPAPHKVPATEFAPFRLRYFGYHTLTVQHAIIDAVERAKPGELVMVNVPPEWGKTTLMEDYISMRIAHTPNVRITVLSEGQPHARKIIARVARRMTDLRIAKDYIKDFGPFRTEKRDRPWSADFLTVYKADHDERDYTLEARGWRSAIAGTRADLMIVDDIQSRRSLLQTDEMLATFRQDIISRVGKLGVILVVGTRVGIGDIYETLEDEGMVDHLIRYPAIRDGKSTCPELWPTEALMNKRDKMGGERGDVWARTYQQAPLLAGAATFTKELTDSCLDISRTLGETRLENPFRIIGVDPALTNFNAMVAAAVTSDQMDLLDVHRHHHLGSVENLWAKLDVMCELYDPHVVVIEHNSFQKGLIDDARLAELRKIHGFTVVAHTTGRNKLDEQLGVARMPTSFIKGELSIPYGDGPTRLAMDLLLDELWRWRGDVSTRRVRQDVVMALWFVWLEWQRRRTVIRPDVPKWAVRALPWAPTPNLIRQGAGR